MYSLVNCTYVCKKTGGVAVWMCVQGGSSESSGDSSSSDSESSSDESLQFDDGLDEDLVGDEEDRSKLSNMTDIEREQEMYMR